MEIISEKEARARGLTRYFTGVPCKYGHVDERRVSDRHCCECERERTRAANMTKVSAAAGTKITPHDLRRTFDDVAMECKVDSDQRRQLLNHLAADVHARHYANNRKSLAAAVEAIGAWITAQGDIATAMLSGANVVALRG